MAAGHLLSGAVAVEAYVPMLARLASRLPIGECWRYEPKFDGFRGLVTCTVDGRVRVTSRNSKDLSRFFPEIAQMAKVLPPGTIVDGELVVTDAAARSDFGALQARLTMNTIRLQDAVRDRPAVIVAFDVLQWAGRCIVEQPLEARRRRLEELVAGLAQPCLQLVLQTADVNLALAWLAMPGIEGVVAKRADGRYRPGRRDWLKVKRERSAECVVLGVAGDDDTPTLILGLRHPDGRLHMFGTSRPLLAHLAAPVATLVSRAGPIEGPIASRWQHQQVNQWRRVPPELVCEVRFAHVDGRWLRQPAAVVRWRPDRTPEDCGLDQLQIVDL